MSPAAVSWSRPELAPAGHHVTPLHSAEPVAAARLTGGPVDCQSHLFFLEVLERMRRRMSDALVYELNGTTILKMGDWLRNVPPASVSVDAKLASMDASGIALTLLSTNDPGPEWFGDDGPAVAQLIHDSLAGVIARHPTRFRGLCTLPLMSERAAAESRILAGNARQLFRL